MPKRRCGIVKIYGEPRAQALFQRLAVDVWERAGMDWRTATAGVTFYLGENPHSEIQASGYYLASEKIVVIPSLGWEWGLEEVFIETVHHELGHHIHMEYMGDDGSELWQEWGRLTGNKLDFKAQRIGAGGRYYVDAWEKFANDFSRTVSGYYTGREVTERRRFYFGLWGQKTMKKKVELVVGSKVAMVDGQTVGLDVLAQIRDGRTLVPFRFVGEAFGAKVDYFPKVGRVERITAELEVAL
jgi:hypothetical protein